MVRATGELDLASAPVLVEDVQRAAGASRLIALDLQDVTFVDCAGLAGLREASRAASRAGRRVLVTNPGGPLRRLLDMTTTPADLDVLDAHGHAPRRGVQPADPRPANPVNERFVAARVMAVSDRKLWLHAEDGSVQRAWAPDPKGEFASPGRPIQLLLDRHGTINGWLDPISMVGVNQRHLDPARAPLQGDPMVCQGPCGLVWQAPAASLLAEREERCLTCAGPLAPG